MRTLVLGDTHGRSLWKSIVEQEKPDRLIFIGDYFDSFDIKGVDQINNFQDIIAYKQSGQCEVVMLIGNHDHHYFPEIGDTGTSGYQTLLAPSIQFIIDENREHLQMAYQMGDFLFSHAGVSSVFMDNVYGVGGWKVESIADDLNEMYKYKPKTFIFNGFNPYGDDECQTPIWIRPRSLMKANKDTLRTKVIQVVGHTSQNQIDVKGKATGGRYYFIDTLGTSGEFLIIEDSMVTSNTVNNG